MTNIFYAIGHIRKLKFGDILVTCQILQIYHYTPGLHSPGALKGVFHPDITYLHESTVSSLLIQFTLYFDF